MALHRGSSQNESTTGSSNPLITEANPALGQRLTSPKSRLAQDPVPADVAYQLIHDELLLDGSARLNLATFVTTGMEPQARQLMADCVDKNMIDKDEYPQTAELERRCVAMLADLWHAPSPDQATGCSTTGSSEACMLAGIALHRRWAARVNVRNIPCSRLRHAGDQVVSCARGAQRRVHGGDVGADPCSARHRPCAGPGR